MRPKRLYALCIVSLCALLTLPQVAVAESHLGAGDEPERENLAMTGAISPLEREVLQQLTEDQLQAFLQGASAHGIVLRSGKTLEEFLHQRGIGSLNLSWYSIDGGGGTAMTGGGFELFGTLGQPEAGELRDETFALVGGILAVTRAPHIFSDGFESADTTGWDEVIAD